MRQQDIARKVLSKALFDSQAVLPMIRQCDPEDFPDDLKPVFLSIREAAMEGREVSVEILQDVKPELKDRVIDYVIEETVGTDQEYWVRRLKECASEQRLIRASKQIADLLLKDQRPYGVKRLEAQRIWDQAIGEGAELSRMVRLRAVHEERSTIEFRPVGFPMWEMLTKGLAPGRINVLAGRPSRGKTTLMVQWATNMAKAGMPTLVVPLEIGASETAELAAAQGCLSDEEVYVLQDSPCCWPTLALDLRWAIQAGGIKALFIDHLGFIRMPRRKDQTRVEEIREILQSLRSLLQQTGTACLLVCQLNRNVEGRRSEQPTLADIRESGEIEQQADTVNFLFGEKEELTKAQVRLVLRVDKNRYGPTGNVEVIFDRPKRRFTEKRG